MPSLGTKGVDVYDSYAPPPAAPAAVGGTCCPAVGSPDTVVTERVQDRVYELLLVYETRKWGGMASSSTPQNVILP